MMFSLRAAITSAALLGAAALTVPGLVAAQSAAAAPSAPSAPEAPKYGGTLSVGNIYVTLSAQSWELADWHWKQADDTGHYIERLFAADFSKARRNGGPHRFRDNNYIPLDAVRGELAESWRWMENPLRLEIKLRQGVMFPEKKGVMVARELVADDVVFSHEYLRKSPRAAKEFWDHITKVEATARHTVVFTFKDFHAEWDMRSGYGHYAHVFPKEMAQAGMAQWKNHTGSGPFLLTDFLSGNSATYTRNPVYWDKEVIGGVAYKLPFADRLVVRTIKDEAAQHAALRTGKLDILELVRWQAVEELKKNAPAIKWVTGVANSGYYLSLRTDQKPFDDVRVRRAMNMAVNKDEIIKGFYGGHAVMLGFPMHPDWKGYYEPLSAMPESVKELFTYNPEKARKLLTEAGYPNGFTFRLTVCSCAPAQMDMLPMLVAYYERVGIKVQVQTLEYGAFYAQQIKKAHSAGYLMSAAHGSPTISVSKLYKSGQNWNTGMVNDPALDKRIDAMFSDRVEASRQRTLKAINREMLDYAPFVWLPTPMEFSAYWPWVKNYDGELRGGGGRPGPVYARIWIDQDLKKKMGY